jgi:hypothetical protein
MSVDIGSTVFHRKPNLYKDGMFDGPGIILAIKYDALLDVNLYRVFWKNSEEVKEHSENALSTIPYGT